MIIQSEINIDTLPLDCPAFDFGIATHFGRNEHVGPWMRIDLILLYLRISMHFEVNPVEKNEDEE